MGIQAKLGWSKHPHPEYRREDAEHRGPAVMVGDSAERVDDAQQLRSVGSVTLASFVVAPGPETCGHGKSMTPGLLGLGLLAAD